jgi:hypothetical protein
VETICSTFGADIRLTWENNTTVFDGNDMVELADLGRKGMVNCNKDEKIYNEKSSCSCPSLDLDTMRLSILFPVSSAFLSVAVAVPLLEVCP